MLTRRARLLACAPIFSVLALAMTACEPSSSHTYTVDSTGDAGDRRIDGTCATSAGECTLRAALAEDQRDEEPSTIRFDVDGSGTHTIDIGSTLPALSAGNTTIDGYSQSGASVNTAALTSNAVLRIEVRGTGSGGPEGLVVSSAGNLIRGIAFYNLRQTIRIEGSAGTDNTLAGNFLGTNAAGTFGATTFNSNAFGVVVTRSASRNRIGGSAPADRNVISGNAGRGVLLCSPTDCTASTGANDNVIQGNLVGLTPSGTARRANLGHGIDVNAGSSRNRIQSNVISGNNGSGAEVSHGTSTVGNQILDNRIGTDPTGNAGPAYARNTQANVHIEDGPRDTVVSGNVIGNSATGGIKINSLSNVAARTRIRQNRIGISANGTVISNGPYGIQLERGSASNPSGTTDNVIGPDNTIVGNATGIRIIDPGTVRNTITHNSIRGNTGLGIDIAPLGSVNQNDVGDADDGPNTLLNWPALLTATNTTVAGTACGGCLVEVFVADGAATAYGEGATFLAAAAASSAGGFTVPIPSSSSSRVVTATATDGTGNTSEFSRNLAVPAG